MIGIGKWVGKVNTLFFKGEVTIEIKDNNGEYDFYFELPDKFKDIDIRYYDIHAEGNTIKGKGEIAMFPGKEFEASAIIDGDKMTGILKLPFFGNKEIVIPDCHKVSD